MLAGADWKHDRASCNNLVMMIMTPTAANEEVNAFVRGGWKVHRIVDMTLVTDTNKTIFKDDEAKIEFSTRGNLHHEIGHVIIEKLSFKKCVEECAKEGICDAYKFLKVRENGIDGYDCDDHQWFRKIEKFRDQAIKAILSKSGDRAHDIIHGIPASRILRRFDAPDSLRAQLLKGFSAAEIVDPDICYPELLSCCWPKWKLMEGKADAEKRQIKECMEEVVTRRLHST
jgi:hypothetical protein